MTKAGNLKLGKFEVDIFICDDDLYDYYLFLNDEAKTSGHNKKTIEAMFDSVFKDMREIKK